MALKLNHLHLKSPDPQKTAQFYIDTLGATKIADVGEIGVRLDLHGLTLNVTKHIESQTREQKYGMEHIAIDADISDLGRAQGVDVELCGFLGVAGLQMEVVQFQGHGAPPWLIQL